VKWSEVKFAVPVIGRGRLHERIYDIKSATEIHHLQVDGDEVTKLADISNKIGQTFSNNSSSENCNSKFQAESQQLKLKYSNLESYNDLFFNPRF